MNSMMRWIGPGAVVGGLGVAMWCGAGVAGADSANDYSSAGRATHASPAGTDRAARLARTSPDPTPRLAPSKSARQPAPAASRVSASTRATAPKPKPAAALAASSASVEPSSVPVDPAQYAGTYYEQGSVKQFFSIGLVNTKAVYTLKQDGTLGVQNSGNYFFKRGPKSSIVGSAVPVNPINTALNVGFWGTPAANPPGNYLILDRAPDYSWVIVSDPSGRSGYILTRDQTIDPQTYQELVAKAESLGVRGRITKTRQFPT